jgi:hypothetical protein
VVEQSVRRHHLIEEAKVELDLAYEEVKRAENRIMGLEQEYNARVRTITQANGAQYQATLREVMEEKETVQAAIDIEMLYELQGMAVEKFGLMSSAFAIVASVEEVAMSSDLLRNLMFKTEDQRKRKIDIDRSVRAFTKGLRAYSKEDSSHENDMRVRNAWAEIEDLLRGFGRNI